MLSDSRKSILGKREDHSDGLELGYDQQGIGVSGVDHVSDIYEAKSDAAVYGRCDARVYELELGVIDGRLIGFDGAFKLAHQCLLAVVLLLRNDAFLEESLIAVVVKLGIFQLSLVAGQGRFGLLEGDLVRPRVDHEQKLTLLHNLAFLKGDLDDLSIDAAFQAYRVPSLNIAEPGKVDRKIASLRRGNGDLDNLRTSVGLR